MQISELYCSVCSQPYNKEERIPRLLPDCGHTFCTQCLADLLRISQGENKQFKCPEDDVLCSVQKPAEEFPKNFALIRLAEKNTAKSLNNSNLSDDLQMPNSGRRHKHGSHSVTNDSTMKPSSRIQSDEEDPAAAGDICLEHKKKLEIVCVDHQCRICSNCALFGSHKNHDIRLEADVMKEVSARAECLVEMYQVIEQSQQLFGDQNQIENNYTAFRTRQLELKQQVGEKFKELKALIKIGENKVLDLLQANFDFVEEKFKAVRETPRKINTLADDWKLNVKRRLDNLAEKPDSFPFDLLENKRTPKEDVITIGENILKELEKHKGDPPVNVEEFVGKLSVKFNEEIPKTLSNFGTVTLFPGAEVNEKKIQIKKVRSESSKNNGSPMRRVNSEFVSTMVTFEDSTAMSDEGHSANNIFENVSFIGDSLKHGENLLSESPAKLKDLVESPTKIMDDDAEEAKKDELTLTPKQMVDILMEEKVNLFDLSSKFLGDDGAKRIAETINSSKIKTLIISGCGIGDEGAKALFKKLMENEYMTAINLSKNNITDATVDAIADTIRVNTHIKCINLANNKIVSRLSRGKLKMATRSPDLELIL